MEICIDGINYGNYILEQFVNELHDNEPQTRYFEQDSSMRHITHATLDNLVFLYLKNLIYNTPVRNLDDLRNNITRQRQQINEGMLIHVFENIKRLINLCLNVNEAFT